MWLTGYAYITLFSQKLGNLLKPSSLVKPHQQEFVAITSARVVEPGGYSPPLQFLTFACGHFTQIIDFFKASHSSSPPQSYFCSAVSEPLYMGMVLAKGYGLCTQGRFSIKLLFTYFTPYFNYTLSCCFCAI